MRERTSADHIFVIKEVMITYEFFEIEEFVYLVVIVTCKCEERRKLAQDRAK